MIYFTSDWHIGHKQVIEFCGRPFTDLDHMHSSLITNYNKLVKPEDTCIFVGDTTFSNTTDTKKIVQKLNGTKIAVIGNHDPKQGTLLNMGFQLAVNQLSMCIRGHKVLVSHYPFKPSLLKYWSNKFKGLDIRYQDRRHKDDGKTFLIHGHTHSAKKLDGRALHVGVDAWNYTPVSMKLIEKHIDKFSA
jgi:calcineurin-like phosphoesterase family protein